MTDDHWQALMSARPHDGHHADPRLELRDTAQPWAVSTGEEKMLQ
jgi:hypothetical protein